MANYLYNGIELPALPECDKETYPYAVIMYEPGSCFLVFGATPFTVYLPSDTTFSLRLSNGGSWLRYTYEYTGETWSVRDNGTATAGANLFTTTRNPIWCNHDIIRDVYNTLYLAASDPVPVGTPIQDPLSFAMGWQLGCRLRAQRGKKEPVAYLYGGVQLPKIPEIEGYTYRFMTIIVTSSSTSTYLYCSNVPIYKNDVASLFASIIAKADGNVICYPCDVLPDGTVVNDWHRYEDGDKTFTADTKFMVTNTGSIKWANYDILNYSDDSVYLAASEPVPIYK